MGKKREFSEEEVKYIIDNWGKESPHSMKKKFCCTWYAVCNVAKSHNLSLPTSNEWTEKEVETLKELSNEYHYTEIAKMMNKTENAIYLKARKLGIVLIQDRRKWTKEEEIKFSELWGSQKIEDIAKDLKRSIFSLKVKAVRMGLGSMIENNYDLITVSDMVELLNVKTDRILKTWVKLGLNLEKKELTDKKEYYVITLDNLLNFLEANQNEWDSRNVEVGLLGNEPLWLQEKRERDKLENPLWYRRWTDEEIKQAEELFKQGFDYASIAKELERSEWAVSNLLHNLGYKLPKYWSDDEVNFLKENYQNMTYNEMANILGRTKKATEAKAQSLGYQKKITK